MWKYIAESIDKVAIAVLALLVVAMCMVMVHTVESNVTTADIALIQAKNKKRTIQEVALLTAEMRMLQNDVDRLHKLLLDMDARYAEQVHKVLHK